MCVCMCIQWWRMYNSHRYYNGNVYYMGITTEAMTRVIVCQSMKYFYNLVLRAMS